MGVAFSCLKLEFLSRPDLMLYKFVDNSVRVHGHEKSRFQLISAGGRVR